MYAKYIRHKKVISKSVHYTNHSFFLVFFFTANKENRPLNDNLSFEPSCSQKFAVSNSHKDSTSKVLHAQNLETTVSPNASYPYDTNNSMEYSNLPNEPTTVAASTAVKLRLSEPYSNASTPESLTHSINPMNIKADSSEPRYINRMHTDQQPPTYHPHYVENMLENHGIDTAYSAATLNKFRSKLLKFQQNKYCCTKDDTLYHFLSKILSRVGCFLYRLHETSQL